jgi:hypothetical protein
MTIPMIFGRCARHALVAVLSAAALAACGGGGDDGNDLVTSTEASGRSATNQAGANARALATDTAGDGVRLHAPQCDPLETPTCGATVPPTQ